MKTLLSILLLTLLLAWPLKIALTDAIVSLVVIDTQLDYKAPPLESLTVEKKIKRLFGPEAQIALAVFTAESHLRCNAESNTGDFGPAQLNIVHAWRGDIKDCTENLKIAREIQLEQGWNPWQSYQNQSYKKYLKI